MDNLDISWVCPLSESWLKHPHQLWLQIALGTSLSRINFHTTCRAKTSPDFQSLTSRIILIIIWVCPLSESWLKHPYQLWLHIALGTSLSRIDFHTTCHAKTSLDFHSLTQTAHAPKPILILLRKVQLYVLLNSLIYLTTSLHKWVSACQNHHSSFTNRSWYHHSHFPNRVWLKVLSLHTPKLPLEAKGHSHFQSLRLSLNSSPRQLHKKFLCNISNMFAPRERMVKTYLSNPNG